MPLSWRVKSSQLLTAFSFPFMKDMQRLFGFRPQRVFHPRNPFVLTIKHSVSTDRFGL